MKQDDWIQTYTGKKFRPLEAAPEDIDIRDIAHALALQCRFNGHCRVFYSVAEHSVRVSQVVSSEHALWGLLHDAAEAYLTDLPRPVKRQFEDYRLAEEALLRVVAERFQLPWPLPDEVISVDGQLLATEARDLMGPRPDSWGLLDEPLGETITPWTWEVAEQRFLQTYQMLEAAADQ